MQASTTQLAVASYRLSFLNLGRIWGSLLGGLCYKISAERHSGRRTELELGSVVNPRTITLLQKAELELQLVLVLGDLYILTSFPYIHSCLLDPGSWILKEKSH
jgi:hypothetical protein